MQKLENMVEKRLDFTPLDKALLSLTKAIDRSNREPEDLEVRDSVIQRFEYSYELSWKMLKRKCEQVVPSPSTVDSWSFKELIREGAERGYIADPESWFEFREARNATSHAYNPKVAERVRLIAEKFLKEANSLLEKIRS